MPSRFDRARQVAARLDRADVTSRPPVVVQPLGAYRVRVGDVTVSTKSGMVFPLLVRLAYSPGHAAPRGQLLDELWPDEVDHRRNGNLRQLLYKLRLMGLDIVQVDELIRLASAQLVATFALERTEPRFVADVETGDQPFGEFLPAWRGPSALYQEWLEQTRGVVHADVRRILVERLRTHRERADWGTAERYARWLLRFDPLNEDATLVLAESTMMSGGKAEAVAILNDYLEELGPDAREIRLPASQLKKRLSDTPPHVEVKQAPSEVEEVFIGRSSELATIASVLRRAKWNDGAMILVSGDAGIGKSRLIAEAKKLALLEGFFAVFLQNREVTSARPLFTWTEVLPTLLELPGALGCEPESLAALRSLFLSKKRVFREFRDMPVTATGWRGMVEGTGGSHDRAGVAGLARGAWGLGGV